MVYCVSNDFLEHALEVDVHLLHAHVGEDLDGDSAPDGDSRPDTDMPTVGPDEAGRLTLQPVSGAGMVRSSKFRAHIQVGRVVDVAPGK